MSIPNDSLHTDQSYEKTIGLQLKRYRLDQNVNQSELAERAGIARRTITSVENGQGCTLNTLVRILKALNKTELLQPLLDPPPMSPHQIHYLKDEPRKYASKPRKHVEPGAWVWGDEK
ncbi:helix-turn-helix domain-containing protein [Akkermansiaceae bacterium]|nr:helix-turn-helix domain-containing protein [Akkermansiaceae bacterium]